MGNQRVKRHDMRAVVDPVASVRVQRNRTQRAVAARAGRIVRVVGVGEHQHWDAQYRRQDMDLWKVRMARAERGLPPSKVFWAPHDALNAFQQYQPTTPVHAATVHAHGCKVKGTSRVCIGQTTYDITSLVRGMARWWRPRKIVLFVCDSAEAWRFIPDVNVPVWACMGLLRYTRVHEVWEAAGCVMRANCAFSKSIPASGMQRVQ